MRFAPILVALLAQSAGVALATKLDYLSEPEIETITYPDVVLGPGNAVTTTPEMDGVIATNSDGTVLRNDFETFTTLPFVPTPIGEGSEVSSTSGVSFYTLDGALYMVYAVMDEPGNGASFSSRILALKSDEFGSLSQVWEASVSGKVAGTPVVGSDNEYVYVTHNDVDGNGHFTVLSISGEGSKVFEQSGAVSGTPGPYAPIGIAHNPNPYGNFAQGFRNPNDFLCWGHMVPGGTVTGAVSGWTHGFQMPRTDQPDATTSVVTLLAVTWVTNTKPVFDKDGQDMFYSVSAGNRKGAETRVWVGGKNLGTGASYKGVYTKSGGEPPYAPGILSVDETMFYFPSTSASIVGTNSTNGEVIWEDASLPGVIKAQPVASPDGERIYFLTDDGTLVGKDAKTGETVLMLETDDIVADASADISINEDGTYIFYGFAVGDPATESKYFGVKLGSPAAPVAPTATPPAPSPTADGAPTADAPTVEAPTGDAPTEEPTPPTSAASAQAVRLALVGATLGLVSSVFLF